MPPLAMNQNDSNTLTKEVYAGQLKLCLQTLPTYLTCAAMHLNTSSVKEGLSSRPDELIVDDISGVMSSCEFLLFFVACLRRDAMSVPEKV